VFPWKSAFSAVMVCLGALLVLLPLNLAAPPGDDEAWVWRAAGEMREAGSFLPLLNGRVVGGANPLTMLGACAVPSTGDVPPRLINGALGCILAVGTFLYAHRLFGLKSALASSVALLTTLGFQSTYGTLNLAAIPVTFSACAFGLFSLAYLERLPRWCYHASYVTAALAFITGGAPPLVFFAAASALTVVLDLAPSRFFSVHLVFGAAVVSLALISYLTAFRVLGGPGYASASLFAGEHTGLFGSLLSVFSSGIPWVFMLIPAFIQGDGPSDQDRWRRLLPLRIACIAAPLALWLTGRSMPGMSALLVAPASVLAGAWAASSLEGTTRRRPIDSWMLLCSGISVLAVASAAMIRTALSDDGVSIALAAWAAVFTAMALAFAVLSIKRRTVGRLVLVAACSACLGWMTASSEPWGAWERKAAFARDASVHSPLVVHEDDLVMRGLLGLAGTGCMVVPRSAVPLGAKAYLAASSHDLDGLVTSLSERMEATVVDALHERTSYAVILIGPPPEVRP